MYNIGTVTTTANSPKITGTGTRWKDNTTLISVGQVVLIENGSNLLINSIYSIESNTALTLAFPVSAKLTNAKYIILTTMIDSISDGVNKATAQVIASEVYTEILNQWMTAQGTIDVELPTGQKIKLRTVAEMDKQLDGKFDKSGGVIKGNSGALILQNTVDSGALYLRLERKDGESRGWVGAGGAGNDISLNNSYSGKTLTLSSTGAITYGGNGLLQVGDGGWMKDTGYGLPVTITKLSDYRLNSIGYAYASTQGDAFKSGNHHFLNIFGYSTNAHGVQLGFVTDGSVGVRGIANNSVGSWREFYTTGNTTKDAQGNLRAASPIVKVFADHIETNDESEGVTLEKLGVGRYKLKGVLGMNSDASWGGFNGGIVIPKGINGLELVWADYKVLADGDIILETHYRKHADLPPPVVLNRLIAYPEFMDENGNELESYTPCDIPNGHWIDIRVQMPNDSIYNQKQVEAERLAKLEAERLAQEEAKRAAEEAERAEQEAATQIEEQ
ncbi:phage tail fiber protein [Providencia rettgeri]|uniref:phage tail fiber protein n=1 Tax=Providencia rettgeri TaxID=587 RepID=UPI001BA44246|nr:hypothetical protein [Providencia rettgeri]MBS0918205.1 hypothetical protein [Providencia rettgeri]